MKGPDYDHFCSVVTARSGLMLGPDKAYLVQSRLEPVARALGLDGVPAVLAAFRKGGSDIVSRCVDAMATHESLFFRDGTPFEQLKTLMPAIANVRAAGAPLRAWCAACSSGQEPYSLAILARELSYLLGGRRLEIIATDMSEPVLAKARAGVYSAFEVQRGLSPERCNRWLKPSPGGFEISPEIRSAVTFRRHNLLEGALAGGPFDIVFVRNVLIYFDRERKVRVLDQIARVMAPDGALFLGGAETPVTLTDTLEAIPNTRAAYRPRSAAVASFAKSA